ncbi:hypothetical protein ACIF84_30780 [Streptomyces albidoflavus]
MSGSAWWNREIRKADKASPRQGAFKRMDRLRGQLQRLDPEVANRAWREVGDSLQRITDRYTR